MKTNLNASFGKATLVPIIGQSIMDVFYTIPINNQRTLNASTAFALASAIEYCRIVHKQSPAWLPSRMFIYYNARAVKGQKNQNVNAYLKPAIDSAVQKGVCPEKYWGYDVAKYKTCPSNSAYQHALPYKIKSYKTVVPTLANLESCLNGGYPAIFKFKYAAQYLSSSASVLTPPIGEPILGTETALCLAYDLNSGSFLIRVSRGSNWGFGGYVTMQSDYLTTARLSSDFYSIRSITA